MKTNSYNYVHKEDIQFFFFQFFPIQLKAFDFQKWQKALSIDLLFILLTKAVVLGAHGSSLINLHHGEKFLVWLLVF